MNLRQVVTNGARRPRETFGAARRCYVASLAFLILGDACDVNFVERHARSCRRSPVTDSRYLFADDCDKHFPLVRRPNDGSVYNGDLCRYDVA